MVKDKLVGKYQLDFGVHDTKALELDKRNLGQCLQRLQLQRTIAIANQIVAQEHHSHSYCK